MDAVERVEPWFEKAIRDHCDEHGPSGGAWNISMILERLHRASLARSNGWQDIATAPKDGTVILLFYPLKGVLNKPHVVAGYFERMTGSWWFAHTRSGYADTYKPTRWQPLPEPPLDRLRGSEDDNDAIQTALAKDKIAALRTKVGDERD